MPEKLINIATHLAEMARLQPDVLAVAVQQERSSDGRYRYERISARMLDEESNRLARGLERYGICRGDRTVLMVTPGVPFFALTFALFKVGAIPVMVDPGMGIKKLKACLGQAAPSAFIGIPKAHAARVALGWARETIQHCVTVGPKGPWGGITYDALRDKHPAFDIAPTRASDMAAILFTSGSTGTPKGAVYTHGNFDAQIRALRDDYRIVPGERDLATFPLFALFGPALGMAAIVPDMDASRPITADPRNILAAAQDFETTNLFASPALLDRVGRYGSEHGIKLRSLRRVISAGAPALPDALERFATMLPDGVEIYPSYGATEALPLTTIGSRELLRETAGQTARGAGVCVGRPLSGVRMAIVRLMEEAIAWWSRELVLPTGEIGEICVSGDVVTEAYYELPEATRLAKIRDRDTGALWHRMGDVGYFDAEGRLWFCGRKSHRVQCGPRTLFTIPCERVFDTHPDVRRTALVGVRRNGETVPVLFIERNEHSAGPRQKLEDELREIGSKFEHTRSIQTFMHEKHFPVDVRHNAKIFREALAAKAQRRLA